MRLKLAVFALSALALGCGDNIDDDDIDIGDDGTPGDQTPPPPEMPELRANLAGTGPYSTLSGTAIVRILDDGAGFSAEITMRGDVSGAVRPWHVHVGSCNSGGAIVGPAEAYRPLVFDGGGVASSQALLAVALDTGGYHVNVHLAPEQLDILIACGDLIRQ